MLYSILVLNGPNLAALGKRQPEIYGTQGLDVIPEIAASVLGDKMQHVGLTMEQSNSEGGMIDILEQARRDAVQGVILNAGAYTHTSLALADCLAWIGIPTVEVHVSNILGRQEEIRHTNLLAPHTIGLVAGFGIIGYGLGLLALYMHLEKKAELRF